MDADTGQTILDLIFLYDGWNLIAEVNAQTGELIRTYVWGLDLSGSFQGAGGISGLLWVNVETGSHAERYVVAYDGNGNVMGLVSASDGSVVAQYEYGPFAEPLRATGPLAADNPFRFSTKYCDPETGLYYYGYRYYSPRLGRWLSRDPVAEYSTLYAFLGNNCINDRDFLGLLTVEESAELLERIQEAMARYACCSEVMSYLSHYNSRLLKDFKDSGLLRVARDVFARVDRLKLELRSGSASLDPQIEKAINRIAEINRTWYSLNQHRCRFNRCVERVTSVWEVPTHQILRATQGDLLQAVLVLGK